MAYAPPFVPRIAAIGTAVPRGEIEDHYLQWASAQISDDRARALFTRMAQRSGINHRYSVLNGLGAQPDARTFYASAPFPSTAERMVIYAECAPALALEAVDALPDLAGITHIVTASCTGFIAPGLDQILADELNLGTQVERLHIGFMGCYAGITALRTARHIVRSQPAARVLVVAVELCSLHLQQNTNVEALLAMRQFADGAAAALVCGEGPGLALNDPLSASLPGSADLITWTIGDTGFAMHLSGAVPARLAAAIQEGAITHVLDQDRPLEAWAVHPGGRSILDAVERGLDLAPGKLDASRSVLSRFGNMSSATVIFVLEQLLAQRPASGLALAFGPGLAVEGLHFGWIDGNGDDNAG
jgi:alpha-pyrone synthase